MNNFHWKLLVYLHVISLRQGLQCVRILRLWQNVNVKCEGRQCTKYHVFICVYWLVGWQDYTRTTGRTTFTVTFYIQLTCTLLCLYWNLLLLSVLFLWFWTQWFPLRFPSRSWMLKYEICFAWRLAESQRRSLSLEVRNKVILSVLLSCDNGSWYQWLVAGIATSQAAPYFELAPQLSLLALALATPPLCVNKCLRCQNCLMPLPSN